MFNFNSGVLLSTGACVCICVCVLVAHLHVVDGREGAYEGARVDANQSPHPSLI